MIIEVGMGGRLDATNIITPLISVITNIGLDHTQFQEILLMPSL
jgi:dihydrofolate synthase/folylpolyglutamate synthase